MIGVAPDKTVSGIESDYAFVSGNDRDGFEQWLADSISNRLDHVLAGQVSLRFVEVDGKTVCRIDVPAFSDPVFFDHKGTKRFYVRVQNATKEYSGHDLLKYQSERWPHS